MVYYKRNLPGSMMQPKTIAKKLKVLERKVRANTPEVKVHYDSANGTIGPNVLVGEFLTEIAQGTDAGNRIGTRIKVQSVEVRGYATKPIDIYLCKTVDDKDGPLLADFSSGLAGAMGFHEKLHTYIQSTAGNLTSSTDTPQTCHNFLVKKKFPNGLIVEFDNTSGGYGDCTRNSLWFIAINQIVGSSAAEKVYFNIKVEYTDA